MEGDPSPPSGTPAPTTPSQRDPVSRLLATIAIVLAIGMIAGFLYVGHLDRLPGPIGGVGPQGPQGPAGPNGTPGVIHCAGANCQLNRSYANFTANFAVAPQSASQNLDNFTFSFLNCTNESYGTYSCFFSITNDGINTTRNVNGLTYSITPAFNFLGADPTLGEVKATYGQTTNFQLWFQVLQLTGTILTQITLLVNTSVAK